MNYRLLYFAALRDAAGRDGEILQSDACDARELFAEVATLRGFSTSSERLRVAVNGEFTDWGHRLAENDEVVFLPPVSGG